MNAKEYLEKRGYTCAAREFIGYAAGYVILTPEGEDYCYGPTCVIAWERAAQTVTHRMTDFLMWLESDEFAEIELTQDFSQYLHAMGLAGDES